VPSQRDYFDVLGVSRDAGQDDIRKAYRRLARQHHPDVNPSDPEAADRFKELSQAYEVLSDPQKRARYEQFGQAGVDGNVATDFGFGGGFGSFEDVFQVFFGAGGGASAERSADRGADLRVDLEISLEEVLSGGRKTIPVSRQERCTGCGGTGAKEGTRPQSCVACGGAGAVRTSRQTLFGTMSQVTECYRCHGRGQIISDPCPRCRGRGQERQSRRIEVDIPAGLEERSRIRLTGQGEAGPNAGPTGDLYVFVHIKPHPVFRRQGNDLISEIEISFARAALGGQVTIPTLEGSEAIQIPEGAQPGDVFRLRGKGLPQLNRPTVRGDQHVVVRVKTPTHLNERQRRALQEFASASGEELSEPASGQPQQEKGFFEWVRNLFTGHDDSEQGKADRE
jgi:molecular chaperone DnaJ